MNNYNEELPQEEPKPKKKKWITIGIISIVILLILFVWRPLYFAPSKSGKIIDAETGKSIQNAYIFINIVQELPTQEFGGIKPITTDFLMIETDSEGNFNIPRVLKLNKIPFTRRVRQSYTICAIGYANQWLDEPLSEEIKLERLTKENAIKEILYRGLHRDMGILSRCDYSRPWVEQEEGIVKARCKKYEKQIDYKRKFDLLQEEQASYIEKNLGSILALSPDRCHNYSSCKGLEYDKEISCMLEVTEENAILANNYQVCDELREKLKSKIDLSGCYAREDFKMQNKSQEYCQEGPAINWYIDRCYTTFATINRDESICQNVREERSWIVGGAYSKSECIWQVEKHDVVLIASGAGEHSCTKQR